MSAKRRQRFLNPFGLAFLDVMSCGLGAAVLLFLIIDHNLTEQALASESGEVDVVALEESIQEQKELSEQHRRHTRQLRRELDRLTETRVKTLVALAETRASAVEAVDTTELEKELSKKQKQVQEAKKSRQLRDFSGEGQRQYVAGFRITGKRILFLLDRSASMQDEQIATVIYNQFLPLEDQRQSPKWRWARSVLEWMLAGMPQDAQYQVWGFATQSTPVLSRLGWIDASDEERMQAVIDEVLAWVPKGGAQLDKTLEEVNRLSPRPDAVYLITDGLPTQGKGLTLLKRGLTWVKKSLVSQEDRLGIFYHATGKISRPPFNIVLLPLEGDPKAAGAYWDFAMRTRGQFLAPSEDWP